MKTINNKPTARVAINKSVLKKYNVDELDVVYLKDSTEFQIELYNPTNGTILAKIEINGKEISGGGIVIKPAQRIFLERYLDDNKNFKFSTYDVGDSEEVKELIKNNGLIKVNFYHESYNITSNYASSTITIINPVINSTPNPYTFGSVNAFYTSTGGTTSTGTFTCASIETGNIEKGNKSNQSLSNYYGNFDWFSFHTETIKILPDSQRVYSTDELKHKKYCSECGAKLKETNKYCSQCGTKV